MNEIHPTAIISKDAEIGINVYIGPYAIIEGKTQISDECRIEAHTVIREGTILGKNVKVDSHCVLGGHPQHLKFTPETISFARIGENTVIREHVTIHRALEENHSTVVGKDCFLMGSAHVGHDAKVGFHTIIAQSALIGGHVEIGNHVFIGGGAAIHQFVRVGNGVMMGGRTLATYDVPPHLTVAERNQLAGLNMVGLRRRNANQESIGELKKLYNVVLTKSISPATLCDHARDLGLGKSELGQEFLKFFEVKNRQYCKPKNR
jgi:UDP-N-acetylglucosamine acyltransferase